MTKTCRRNFGNRYLLSRFSLLNTLGFGGLKNGELLNAAEAAGFDVLLTGDRSLEYEQNMAGRKIAVVAISAPHWRVVKDHVDRIALAIEGAAPGTFTRVDVGVFVRRKQMPGANLE